MINQNDIKNIIERAVIDYTVDKVIEKIINCNKTALILFTGASIGFSESIKSLRILRGNGWRYTAVMTKSAENVLSEALIKDMLDMKSLVTEDSNCNLKELLDSHNFIIIPSLTINTSSKVANCINDNLITNIIYKSMATGKTIIASINACCPDNSERKAMGFHVQEAYKKKLRDNLEQLRLYDINLTTSEKLADKVNSLFTKQYCNFNNQNSCGKDCKTVKIDERIISRNCILNNNKFSSIKVYKDAIITDLARDEATKLNIEIVRE